MAGPSRKIGPSDGWRAAGGKAPPPAARRRGWQPGDAPGGRRGAGRAVKLMAVVGGLAVAAAGLGTLIWMLWPADPPRLVVVGADPAHDALRLDVPPDAAGWNTGRRLIAWGKKAGREGGALAVRVVADGDNPEALPSTPAGLDDWADKLAGKRTGSSRVVVYLGLHAGVGPDRRPFLHAGKGDRVAVADLLSRLADRLTDRDVLVLLDPARVRPDPLAGLLLDTFADRLRTDPEVQAALARCPRLVVVCGASPGEAAWESEEGQCTAFGRAVLRGLRGDGPDGTTGAITAASLFDFLRAETAAWTAGNRPTAQTPFLLPEGEVGVSRARGVVAAYKSADPVPAPDPDPPIDPRDVQKLWQRHDELAAADPPPAAYAPLAWRRGRELLLRLQQAVRIADRPAVAVLGPAVAAEFDRVAKAPPRPVAKSSGGSVPLAETFGNKPAAAMDEELRKAASNDGLANVRFDRLVGPTRPAEALLAGAVDQFYRTTGGDRPADWARAVTTRRTAERAAFGGGWFGERAWPAVRAAVEKADAARREGEDRLFATAPAEHATAAAKRAEADAGYAAATALGAAVRDGHAVRDRLFADLPFLSRWAAASAWPGSVQACDTAWLAVHALALALDAPGPDLAKATTTARTSGEAARGLFDQAAAALGTAPESQSNWQEHEHLLLTPLVPAAVRAQAIKFSQARTAAWDAGQVPPTVPADPDGPTRRARTAARDHARLAAAALGADRLNAHNAADHTLPRWQQVEARLSESEAPDWPDKATPLGHDLRGHYRRAAAGAAPGEFPTVGAAEAAERASRTAVVLGDDPRPPEPAEVAAAVRWRTLLVGLAARAVRDHWHDEAGEPYWLGAANGFLQDAGRDELAALARRALDAPAVPAEYKRPGRLTVGPAANTPDPLRWTSQRRREIGFRVGVPADFPGDAAGLAVGWRPAVGGRLLKWGDEPSRQPVAVAPGGGGPLAGTLQLADDRADDADGTARPAAAVFFRGQRADGGLTVRVSRQPERVIDEPLPDPAAAVAVRSHPQVPLGQVAILLDYSGSMRGRVDTGVDQEVNPGGHPTRFRGMLDALRGVLLRLPKGTPLRIRQFSAATRKGGDPAPEEVLGKAAGGVTWDSEESQPFKDLMARLEGLYPLEYTPLVQFIGTAVDQDFDAKSGLAKTLVVLTDGMDETREDNEDAAGRKRTREERTAAIKARLPKLKAKLEDLFTDGLGKPVRLFVVPFGTAGADRELGETLFAGVGGFPVPGRLWKPVDKANSAALEQTILEAIYPKLRLVADGRQPDGFDPAGLPSRPDTAPAPPYSNKNGATDLLWSRRVPARTYRAELPPGAGGRDPQLVLAPGDAVVLGFAPAPGGGLRLRRELLAEYYEQLPTVTRQRADKGWAVTCPRPVLEQQTLEAKVFVERVPPHRRPDGGADPTDLSAEPPDPAHDGREVVWFDLEPADPKAPPPPGRLTVTRLFRHAAPCWKLERTNWTAADPKVKVRAVMATEANGLPLAKLSLKLPGPGEETVETVSGPVPGDEVEVRLAVEDRSPGGSPAPPGNKVLVLRVTHPAGRPVLARVVDLPSGQRPPATHRYYPAGAGDARADYTAGFVVPEAAVSQSAEVRVRVNLAAVGWALADAQRDRLKVELDPVRPHGERAGEPLEVTPPADR